MLDPDALRRMFHDLEADCVERTQSRDSDKIGEAICAFSNDLPDGQVTVANFGQPGVADYCNPALAEAAKALDFIHRFGSGIPRAQAGLNKNGNPQAGFVVHPSHVHVTVRPAS